MYRAAHSVHSNLLRIDGLFNTLVSPFVSLYIVLSGCILKLLSASSRNVIHGSDSVESARKEIALWFPEGIAEWRSSQHNWIYEA